MSKHIIETEESIIVGTFSSGEIVELYSGFVDGIGLKLKSSGIDIKYEDISPQITIYIYGNRVSKYYIGLSFGFLQTEEKLEKIMDSMVMVFRELGISIETKTTSICSKDTGEEGLYTISIMGLKEVKDTGLSRGLEELDNTLEVFKDLIKHVVCGEISLIHDLGENSCRIWINLYLKLDLSSLRKMYNLLLRYRDIYGLETDIDLPISEELMTDYGLLKNLLHYTSHIYYRLIRSDKIPIDKKYRYIMDYLDYIKELYIDIRHGSIFNAVCDLLRYGDKLDPRSYIGLLDSMLSVSDALSIHQYSLIIRSLEQGLPSVLERVTGIEGLNVLDDLIRIMANIYKSSNRSGMGSYDMYYESYRDTTSKLLKLYGLVIDALHRVVEKVEPDKLIDYINGREDIHHILSLLVKYRMFNEWELFMGIEPTALVKALEKLLFREYFYREEPSIQNKLSKFRVSDEELVKRYGSVFNRVNIGSYSKKYLRLLLIHYGNILPEDFRARVIDLLYTSAKERLEKALAKKRYGRVIRILKKQPKTIADKLINDLIWPKLNTHINKLLEKDPEKALDFINKLLNTLGWVTYDSPLYLLKAKLQGKRLSIIRKLHKK